MEAYTLQPGRPTIITLLLLELVWCVARIVYDAACVLVVMGHSLFECHNVIVILSLPPSIVNFRGRPNFGFGFGAEYGQMGTFGGHSVSAESSRTYHIRCTFGFGMLQLVNSVVAESRVQSLSCGGRECARCRESLASLCTD